MRHIAALVLFSLSARVWSCSCIGIAPIEEVIASSPILVEGQVVSLHRSYSWNHGPVVEYATVRVTNVLKGTAVSRTIDVERPMCYASLHPELMKVKHTYILPLTKAANGRYEMAACAHTGMERVDDELYLFESVDGAQRRLKPYGKYSDFRRKYHEYPEREADNKRLQPTLGNPRAAEAIR